MHNTNSTAYQYYLASLEEPMLVITQGNGKRHKPITNGIGDAHRMQDEFIAQYGQDEWDRRNVIYNKFIGMTDDERDAQNLAHLQKFGI